MTGTVALYPCSKRGCGAQNRDWQVFETGWPNRIRYWCLNHIPWHVRVAMWFTERLDSDE